ncbi:magnesium chelatase subunit D family protein [Coriobacteriia bacterium Es71-Z0120]|uniref:magnesium chelatase subunit D family protein n=1 Tax=Parvivirga hydrogeniphila TaxID=2939460 RepID=UPI0022608A90|nr:magnesium chelatase subunit D family protein [Parvivirga hydrogeniphila]MCL4079080.1 magnesium chelatase subunit D family protein [Parvivirga hydrogeniphila]
MTRRRFPFSAIVGQDALKSALLINAVDPRVGGVLVRGHKGTAKSTAVRALASILPPIEVVEGCRYGCDPNDLASLCSECIARAKEGPLSRSRRPVRVVDLPVSATEDRLVGTLDIEHALKHGERAFEPGLLADANRGILYVDEVNLLDDHLVDALLDVAASGVNVVEREGVRHEHPARFILVGTMNPEEGELRPQLLDRFGLCVDVETIADPALRVEVMRRRRAFEDDPRAFEREWAPADDAVRRSIIEARHHLDDVAVDDDLLFLIASICASLGVEGHRADLVMARAATAFALLNGEREVRPAHIKAVAPMVLAHRMRKTPFDEQQPASERLRNALAHAGGSEQDDDGAQTTSAADPRSSSDAEREAAVRVRVSEGGAADGTAPAVRLDEDLDRIRRSVTGRTQQSTSRDGTGRYTRSEPVRPGARIDVAFDATIRAAAPHQSGREGDLAITLEPSDLRNKVRTKRVGASIVFCVDASGSMGASNRMEAAKAAVLELLVGAYQRRDRVGLVAFRGEGAEVLLAPTASVELAQLKLRSLPVGGATPLAHGLIRSLEILESERKRNHEIVPWLVLVTDGRANVGVNGGLGSEDARVAAQQVRERSINAIVIDTTAVPGGGSAAREIARVAGADYVRLTTVDSQALLGVVKERIGTAG